jgi:hypothetical protein
MNEEQAQFLVDAPALGFCRRPLRDGHRINAAARSSPYALKNEEEIGARLNNFSLRP